MAKPTLEELAQGLIDKDRESLPSLPGKELPAPKAQSIYSPALLVQCILDHQSEWTRAQIAGHFGQREHWLATAIATDVFQAALEPYRHLIQDPYYTATMEERFRALAIHGASVMHSKLEGKEVSDFMAIKAAEVGVKALGMGQATESSRPVGPTGPEAIAQKILTAMQAAKERALPAEIPINAEFEMVNPDGTDLGTG